MMYPGREERAVAVLKLWLHEKGGGRLWQEQEG
jgi:hypothetical protein